VIVRIAHPCNGPTGIDGAFMEQAFIRPCATSFAHHALLVPFPCTTSSPGDMSMPPEPPPTRRLAIALTAAVASTTIAIGVTAASLLGWLRPTEAPASEAMPAAPAASAPSPVIFVPVTPATPAVPAPAPLEVDGESVATVQLAVHERDHHHEHESHREHDEDDDD
jgi:hypothetical protein